MVAENFCGSESVLFDQLVEGICAGSWCFSFRPNCVGPVKAAGAAAVCEIDTASSDNDKSFEAGFMGPSGFIMGGLVSRQLVPL